MRERDGLFVEHDAGEVDVPLRRRERRMPRTRLQFPNVGRAADYLNPVYAAGFQLAARENSFGQLEHTAH